MKVVYLSADGIAVIHRALSRYKNQLETNVIQPPAYSTIENVRSDIKELDLATEAYAKLRIAIETAVHVSE